jgi:hypothetical protein
VDIFGTDGRGTDASGTAGRRTDTCGTDGRGIVDNTRRDDDGDDSGREPTPDVGGDGDGGRIPDNDFGNVDVDAVNVDAFLTRFGISALTRFELFLASLM